MRTTRWILTFLGYAFLAAGAGAAVWVLVASEAHRLNAAITAATFLVVGLVLVRTGRYVAGLDTSALLRDGSPGTARVLTVRDTGVVVNGVNLVVNLGLRVSVTGRPPYDVSVRHVLAGRSAWGSIQPGAIVPVRVDPADPTKVAIAPAGPVTEPDTEVTVTTVRPDDIVAGGVASYGQLLSVEFVGPDAGELTPDLPVDHADDPLVRVGFSYVGPGGTELRTEALTRVPDGKDHVLAPGRAVPVSYLPHDPQAATIDWARA
ncbi:hypothetical protein [Luedemannella helvata]|uniref:DUF4131 domain-containing protein n=1 Tax=Luedemannella helvata TaxID=349315 RepID=A0ABN2JX04_9ACTN